MGVDVGGGGGGGDGSREKGVRHLAPDFKSPISLHKDQLSTSGDDVGGEGVPLVCSHFVPQIGRGEKMSRHSSGIVIVHLKAFLNLHRNVVPSPTMAYVALD